MPAEKVSTAAINSEVFDVFRFMGRVSLVKKLMGFAARSAWVRLRSAGQIRVDERKVNLRAGNMIEVVRESIERTWATTSTSASSPCPDIRRRGITVEPSCARFGMDCNTTQPDWDNQSIKQDAMQC